MKLEKIGFYTLEDSRAKNTSLDSPLWRCELILTGACNFRCLYCRGLKEEINKTLSLSRAKEIVTLWAKDGLRNIRFSGGEPTIYKGIDELVKLAKKLNVQRIALSTNGSADYEFYEYLHSCGVNDFSISLDSCCASTGDKMSGGIYGSWQKVTTNIQKISKLTYTTVGVVVTEENLSECINTIKFADGLGVSDIRIIPSAQYNQLLNVLKEIPAKILDKHPILKYRVNNAKMGRHVRGIKATDYHSCPLVIDDMAVAGDYHFPCIIYLREQGNAIGKVGDNMRKERFEWFQKHDTYQDEICRKNCLDVCLDYNNRVKEYGRLF